MIGSDAAPSKTVSSWCEAIEASRASEDAWRKSAKEATSAYIGGERADLAAFNLFHSNIETLHPAIYNSVPVPDVRRRFGDTDEVGKTIADLIERGLSYSVDAYDFDGLMASTVIDGLVAGRGVVRIQYHKDQRSEKVTCKFVPWSRFYHPAVVTWDDLPWAAFEHFLSRDEVMRLNPQFAGRAAFRYAPGQEGGLEDAEYKSADKTPEEFRCARVFEVWDKSTGQVFFISPDHRDAPISVVEDPLSLEGFFPVPRPLMFLSEPGLLCPICSYAVYKQLLDDLDHVSRRIRNLVKQVRPRGLYDGNAVDIEALATAGDGELVPMTTLIDANTSMGNGGIEKRVSWFPIEATVVSLRELVAHREMLKQQIYEVTGISDIIRGASKATETATAQGIKSGWASLRLERMKGEVARFARDLFRLKAELMCQMLSPETWASITSIKLMSAAEKQQIGMWREQNPEEMERLGKQNPEMVAAYQRPTADEVFGVMRSDAMRAYRIDIETDSTVRTDVQRRQEQSAAFLQGTTAYISAMAPIMQTGLLPPQTAIEIYLAFARQFKLGKTVEDALEQLRGQAEEHGPALMAKMQEKMQGDKGEGAKPSADQAKMQADQQSLALKAQAQQANMAIEGQKLQLKKYEIDTGNQVEMEKARMQQIARIQRPVGINI